MRFRTTSRGLRSNGPLEGVLFEDLCFHAQQAAEKAIKAVLICRQVEFPYTHDLAQLLTLADASGPKVPTHVLDAIGLTRFAAANGYPGFQPPLTATDHAEAVTLAERVLRWAEAADAPSP